MKLNRIEKEYEKRVAWVWSQFTENQRRKVKARINEGKFDQSSGSRCLIGIPFPLYDSSSRNFGEFTGKHFSKKYEVIAREVYNANVGSIDLYFNIASKIIKAYVKKH